MKVSEKRCGRMCALFLLLALAVSCLSGCGGGSKEVTAEDIVTGAQENMAAAESMSGTLELAMEGTISSSGVSLDMTISMLMDLMACQTEEGNIAYIGGDVTFGMLGMKFSMSLECYTVEEGDVIRTYTCTDGEWTYEEGSRSDLEDNSFEEMVSSVSIFCSDADNWTLAEELQEVDGVSCYVLTAMISSADMGDFAELVGSILEEEVSDTDIELPLTLYVDAENLIPVAAEVDCTLMAADLLAGSDAAGSEFTTYTVAIRDLKYGNVEEITIPEEALEAAASAETAAAVSESGNAASGYTGSTGSTGSTAAGGAVYAGGSLLDGEITLVDNEDITIRVTGEDTSDSWEYILNVYMENKTDRSLTLSVLDGSINGLMLDLYGYETLSAGKKVNTTFSVYWEDLETAGISEITDIGLCLWVRDDDYSELLDGIFHIYPQGEAAAAPYVRSSQTGDLILLGNDFLSLTVVGSDYDDYWEEYEIYLYLENRTDREMGLYLDNFSVSDYMVSCWWGDELMPGSSAYSVIYVDKDVLEQNGITEVDSIEFELYGYDSDTYEDFFEEYITIPSPYAASLIQP